MRVLIAVDGSPCSEVCVELAASVSWPPGSTLRAVTAVDPASALESTPWIGLTSVELREMEQSTVSEAQSVLDRAMSVLGGHGYDVESAFVRGRAATAIVEEAETWRAQIVVIGSRGHGRIGSMLLGSVSAEVVDRAPCPVLVARRPSVSRALLCHDGSSYAMAAEALVMSLPLFKDVPIDVLSVGRLDVPVPDTDNAAALSRTRLAYRPVAEGTIGIQESIAIDAVARLDAAGLHARPMTCGGDPAQTILEIAVEHADDLICVGTHGRTGFERLRMGSVARNVLLHTRASVLITRSNVGAHL